MLPFFFRRSTPKDSPATTPKKSKSGMHVLTKPPASCGPATPLPPSVATQTPTKPTVRSSARQQQVQEQAGGQLGPQAQHYQQQQQQQQHATEPKSHSSITPSGSNLPPSDLSIREGGGTGLHSSLPTSSVVKRMPECYASNTAQQRGGMGGMGSAECEICIKGDSLKEAVVMRCLKSMLSNMQEHPQKCKLLMEKFATQRLGDVSFMFSSDRDAQEKIIKEAIAGAVAEALCLIVAHQDVLPTLGMHTYSTQNSQQSVDSVASGDSERLSSMSTSRTQHDLTTTSAAYASAASATSQPCRSSSAPQSPSRTQRNVVRIITAGTPPSTMKASRGLEGCNPNTPKVLNLQDFQCFFCGVRGAKNYVRSTGAQHGAACPKFTTTASSSATTAAPVSPSAGAVRSEQRPVSVSHVVTTAKVFEALAAEALDAVPLPAQTPRQPATAYVQPQQQPHTYSRPLPQASQQQKSKAKTVCDIAQNCAAMQQQLPHVERGAFDAKESPKESPSSLTSTSLNQSVSEDSPFTAFYKQASGLADVRLNVAESLELSASSKASSAASDKLSSRSSRTSLSRSDKMSCGTCSSSMLSESGSSNAPAMLPTARFESKKNSPSVRGCERVCC